MPRVHDSLRSLENRERICDRCKVGRTWEPACKNCGKHLCEPCFQFSENKCCGIDTYYIPERNGFRRIPQLPNARK